MSWTSEQDSPSSRPPDDDLGIEAAAEDDIPEDGPLDPSVFDGLFDDLVDDRSDEVDDNPLDEFLAVTLTGDLDSDLVGDLAGGEEHVDEQGDGEQPREADGSFATATSASEDVVTDQVDLSPGFDAGLDEDLDAGVAADEDPDVGLDLDEDLDAGLAVDEYPDDPIDEADLGPLDDAADHQTFDGFVDVDHLEPDLDELGRPLPPAMPSRDDAAELDQDIPVEAGGFFDTDPHDDLDALEGDDATTVSLGLGSVDGDRRPDLLPIEPDFSPTDGFGEIETEPFDDLGIHADVDHEADLHVGYDGFDADERAMADAGRPPAIRPEDGPVRASPPIQHDPRPEPELAPAPPAEEEAIPAPVGGEQRTGRSQRVLLALAAAIVVGGGLGVGGAMLLSRIIDRGDSTPSTAAAAGTEDNTETAAGTEDVVGADTAGPPTRLQITALRFAPDGTLNVEPSPSLDLLAAAIERSPTEPIVATVRTFTEATAAADLALSRSQAEALTTNLIELGADPEQISIIGLGRSLLSGAQPVPNFVVPSAGLEPSPVGEIARRIGPFAIGLDPTTGQLRAESIAALDALAGALAADPDGRSLTLAAYNFDQPDRAANEGQARLVGEAAVARLTEAGIDPARLTTIVAGDEPFAVPDRVANHIDLTWGAEAAGQLAIASLAIDRIDFAEGSSDLGPEAAAIVDELANLLIESEATAIIDVHSFDGVEIQERVELSVTRAQTIGQRLLGAGVPTSQLRLHGGTSSQFRGEDRICRVVVTVLQPPDRS